MEKPSILICMEQLLHLLAQFNTANNILELRTPLLSYGNFSATKNLKKLPSSIIKYISLALSSLLLGTTKPIEIEFMALSLG